MLKSIHIRNFALAEDLHIEFQAGLNILTGETGTGKSILVNAIAAVLGERVYTDVVRTGSEKALVEGVFDIRNLPQIKHPLESKGIEASEELLLRREISARGSSRAFINDLSVTVTTLKEVGDLLTDIHGQHEHQSLLRREIHRGFLDALGQLASPLGAVAEKYRQVKSLEKLLRELQSKQQEIAARHELYTFQLQEIEKVAPTPGEDEALQEERKILANIGKLFEICGRLSEIFNGEETNLLNLVGEADQRLTEIANFSREMEKLQEEFSAARIVLEETSRNVEEFQNSLEFDPQRLEEVEVRLNLIAQLKKKYAGTIEEILVYQKEIREALKLRENYQFEIERLDQQYQQAIEAFNREAADLSRQRRQVAAMMEHLVQEQLALLGMPRTRFQVRLEKQEDPNGLFLEDGKHYTADEFGVDQVEFFISPNPGEDFKPLNKIASGGEISRIMLALKNILAEIDEIPTLVFDEIDNGVSGRIAQSVGRCIYELSKTHQILSITHLPQIASYGDAHFLVQKYVEEGRTFTAIVPLNKEQRVEAIARLMTGENISEAVLESARQLIEEVKTR